MILLTRFRRGRFNIWFLALFYLVRENKDLHKEIGDLRRDIKYQFDKQGRILKLALGLKEVEERLDRGKQRRFSSPQ